MIPMTEILKGLGFLGEAYDKPRREPNPEGIRNFHEAVSQGLLCLFERLEGNAWEIKSPYQTRNYHEALIPCRTIKLERVQDPKQPQGGAQ
ncbi:hypothetical protein FJZ17_03775 [Candidatus Pacearchaeota archaeon]|nr:hypothetical protein [Candidatus Pacearchaeota archaeon]